MDEQLMSDIANEQDGRKPGKKAKRGAEEVLKVARARLNTSISALSQSRQDELEDLKF